MRTDEQVSRDTVTGPPPQARVMELITSLWRTHVTAAIARLGVPDHLVHGPRTAAELAAATSADAGAMARLVRAGAGLGLFEEVEPDRYALTALGECLVTGVGTFRDYAIMMTDPFLARPLEHFAQAITTGRPAAQAALGQGIWDYLREQPDQASHFAGAMTGLSAARAPVVAAHLDTSPYRRIVDVGGGQGLLLRALLAGAPRASGVLFDLPEVAAGAANPAAGPAGPPIEVVGGSFFDGVPAGADLYVLAHVLCDWDDAATATILANCHRAGQPGHSLAIVEALLPPRPGDALIPFLLDPHLLVTNGGKIRLAGEFSALLTRAGYQLLQIIDLPGGQNIVLARAF